MSTSQLLALDPARDSALQPDSAGGTVRLLTLNVAHGRRHARHQALLHPNTLLANLALIATVLRREQVDVAALQEADGPSVWSGRFDHVSALSRLARLTHSFRGEHNRLSFRGLRLASGTALLSRFPLRSTQSHAFRQNWRDTKGFVTAAVELPGAAGQTLDVISVHLDFLAPRMRRRQIEQLVESFRLRRRPLAVMGDFNCDWRERRKLFALLDRELGLRRFATRRVPTYPARRPLAAIDWILISDELEFTSYRRLEDRLSDHLGIVADVRLRTPRTATAPSPSPLSLS